MQILHDIRKSRLDGPTVLTIGNFDGVHRGHQALLDLVLAQAEVYTRTPPGQVNTGLITFHPHPLEVLRPDIPLQLLSTAQERLDLAAQQGINTGIIHPFDMETARMAPRTFMQMLVENLGLVCLVTGPDFALGRDRTGDLDALAALGAELGYTVRTLSTLDWKGEPVRSRVIRELLGQGDVERAARRLGRRYTVTGVVTAGDGRGRQIGVPTANVDYPSNKLLPANGVYVTRTVLHPGGAPGGVPDGGPGAEDAAESTFNSVTNVGVRPTVDGVHHKIETHLLDFPPPGPGSAGIGSTEIGSTEINPAGDLYGRTVTVEFIQRLRGEKRFAGLDKLVAQIQADIRTTRQIFQRLDTP